MGAGFIPGVSTVHDASVLLTGYNAITGERVGWGGRTIAFIGMVTPVSGGQIRGAGKLLSLGGKRVAKLYHYTDAATAGSIMQSGRLGIPGRKLYLTPASNLGPLQAQIELSLPAGRAATHIFEVSTQGLDVSRVLKWGRVEGNVFNRGGGGVEVIYNGVIDADYFRLLP